MEGGHEGGHKGGGRRELRPRGCPRVSKMPWSNTLSKEGGSITGNVHITLYQLNE